MDDSPPDLGTAAPDQEGWLVVGQRFELANVSSMTALVSPLLSGESMLTILAD